MSGGIKEADLQEIWGGNSQVKATEVAGVLRVIRNWKVIWLEGPRSLAFLYVAIYQDGLRRDSHHIPKQTDSRDHHKL